MIILSGASGGLGYELLKLVSKENDVIAFYYKNKIESEKNVEPYMLNINNEESIKDFIVSHRKKLKKITLINLASVSHDGLIANYETELWDQTFSINVKSNFLLCKNLLPFMVSERWGRIINISSYVGANGRIGAGAYSSSKSALVGLTLSLSKEYGKFNITSNLLELGYFNKGLINSLSKEDQEKIRSMIPLKRFGKTDEILNAINFIQNSEYVNGSIIKINGGL